MELSGQGQEAGVPAVLVSMGEFGTESRWTEWSLLALGLGSGGGCASTAEHAGTPRSATHETAAAVEVAASLCDPFEEPDYEIANTASSGSILPNVRRAYRRPDGNGHGRRVLACREVDTNLDGNMDVVRLYDEQGVPFEERADTDYDGAIDTWIRFGGGRILQVELDNDWDGDPDEFRYYVRGKLSRIQRDTNADREPDVWEVYVDGQLERMGIDEDFDGRVDRWNRGAVQDATRGRGGSRDDRSLAADSSAAEGR